jgi:hypothetical protein
MIGYFLVAIVISLATVILVYGAFGYGINTKTGQIIENGLLFVDSKPGGADIFLNGKKQPGPTAARLVLPAGDYKLSLSKEGYVGWQRNFVLDEHKISRYIYPFLFPSKPQTTDIKTYAAMPPDITQSPDQRWLLVQQNQDANVIFEQYDTSNLATASQPLTLPKEVYTPATDSSFKAVEWASDNKHVLLAHTLNSGQEFIIFDRTDPAKSLNLNRLFKVNPTQVALRNKKIDQVYIYDQAAGTLQVGDTGQAVLAPVFLRRVLAFKPYGDTLLTYVTDADMPAGKVEARIWQDGTTYPLSKFNAGTIYLIDAAQFQGHWYYVAGSDKSVSTNIYKDPIDQIKSPAIGRAIPTLGFSEPGATNLNFSDNTRFIGIQAGQKFAVYDIETDTAYHYTVKNPLTSPLHWMDGHRWIGQTGNSVYVEDYDNTNSVLVTPTAYNQGGYFSSDYNQMITLVQNPAGQIVLERVDMRAGSDLPKNGQQ